MPCLNVNHDELDCVVAGVHPFEWCHHCRYESPEAKLDLYERLMGLADRWDADAGQYLGRRRSWRLQRAVQLRKRAVQLSHEVQAALGL